MSLRTRLARHIAQAGPISIADFMDRCLHDPEGGYYATCPKLGEKGDFITAPHVSQMFGELLGLWATDIWEGLGRPPRVRLVELGPGEGVMMTDVLRAAKAAPGFLDACEVWLVETSAPLASRQARAMKCAPVWPRWAPSLAAVPVDAPLIVLANEFLDCLPIRQAVKTPEGWGERLVGVEERGRLGFRLGEPTLPDGELPDEPLGSVREWSDALIGMGRTMGERIGDSSGAGLFIDYGRDAPGSGDTLQALRGHCKEDPLANPGGADLTAHVDFPAFLRSARGAGALTPPLVCQGDFLRALGVETRAAALARAWPENGARIVRQLERLIAPDQMGHLFKVACVHSPGLAPAGFAGRL